MLPGRRPANRGAGQPGDGRVLGHFRHGAAVLRVVRSEPKGQAQEQAVSQEPLGRDHKGVRGTDDGSRRIAGRTVGYGSAGTPARRWLQKE